jgi:hypothetical protein
MNNDRPPACSSGLGEDGKLLFNLQWPNSYTEHAACNIENVGWAWERGYMLAVLEF